jgi:hypothetical protein
MSRTTKRDEIRAYIKRTIEEGVLLHSARMADRVAAETIRQRASALAGDISWHVCEEYRYLELADIFEWKRERVRR